MGAKPGLPPGATICRIADRSCRAYVAIAQPLEAHPEEEANMHTRRRQAMVVAGAMALLLAAAQAQERDGGARALEPITDRRAR